MKRTLTRVALLGMAMLVGFAACEKDNDNTGIINGYEWVDLGLPSGLKWATCNVGATQPHECGTYFSWGEIEAKDWYSEDTYKFGKSDSISKYSTSDGITQLALVDDTARRNMGTMWRLPTKEDITDIINKMWEEYELTPNNVGQYRKPDNVALTQRKVNQLRTDIKELGSVNVDAIEEYKETKERYDYIKCQLDDLEASKKDLCDIISKLEGEMKTAFIDSFNKINENFGKTFSELFGGGSAELVLEDENDILECNIEIKAQPPGKNVKSLSLLSGGETQKVTIARMFAKNFQ